LTFSPRPPGDHQWIHVDPERAKSGPFGTTVAHGYLTISLLPALLAEIIEVKGPRFIVNYGLNRLRFPSPVPVGSRVRLGATLPSLEAFRRGPPGHAELCFRGRRLVQAIVCS
jgi:acyl dehydratase